MTKKTRESKRYFSTVRRLVLLFIASFSIKLASAKKHILRPKSKNHDKKRHYADSSMSMSLTLEPTKFTSAPSPQPSHKPTDSCIVGVEITCVASEGNNTPCYKLTPPNRQCSVGININILKFRILNSMCTESQNRQDEDFHCVENNEMVAYPKVGVVCEDMDSNTIGQADIDIGGIMKVEPLENGSLPDTTTCTILDRDGDVLQEITINTSGDVALSLKDKFGALELVGCVLEDDEPTDCIVPITYSYVLKNNGQDNAEVTVLQRTRNEETADLLDLLQSIELSPSQITTIDETESIDICTDRFYHTTVLVSSEVGDPCTEEYQFEIEPAPVS